MSDVTPQSTSFLDHRRVLLDLSNDLRTLQKHASELRLDGAIQEIGDVLDRMETDRFSLAVVGEMKRGKSTFINALLGAEVLPADVVPTTATLNRVTYGFEKRVVLEYHDGRSEIVTIEELPARITKLSEEAEQASKLIREAVVYYPSPYCRNNVDVIDTPGLNDDDTMTNVTLSVLPKVDAAIMVVMAQAPFSEYEATFLEDRLLTADLGRIIFVVTGLDRFENPADGQRVLADIEKRIVKYVLERAKRQFGEDTAAYEPYLLKIGKPKVFGVSGREALIAKRTNDMERLERSGYPVFEANLQQFLTEHRGIVMLQVPLNRSVAASREILNAIAMRTSALSLEVSAFEAAYAESSEKIEAARRAWQVEQSKIEDAGARLRAKADERAVLFLQELMGAISKAIDAMPISDIDIERGRRKALDTRLTSVVDSTTTRTMETYTNLLQQDASDAISHEAERLTSFQIQMSSLMSDIAERFSTLDTSEATRRKGEGVIKVISALTWPGVYSGYQTAGWKGAGVGLLATVGTVWGTVAVASLVGIVAGPAIVLGALAASFFTGRKLTEMLFSGDAAAHYREKSKNYAIKRIEQHLSIATLRAHFADAADEAFSRFKASVRENSEARLTDTTRQLQEARAECGKSRESKDHARTELEARRAEVEQIKSRAASLLTQLSRSESL